MSELKEYQCDVCSLIKPISMIRTIIAYGIETDVCDDCLETVYTNEKI